jgi:hypothetical protein
MTVEIETGIPIPPRRYNRSVKKVVSWYQYPWRTLEIGQSFVHPSSADSVRALASRMGKDLKRKFTVRETVRGCRVWRVK